MTVHKNNLSPSKFKKKIEGKSVDLFFLKNKNGLEMAVSNYGARVVSLHTPDRENNFEDLVLGYESIDEYLTSPEKYFGATIGRYANRIAGGRFTLLGKTYQIPTGNSKCSLHGGEKGFDAVVWEAEQVSHQKLDLSYFSKDGEQGFPGNLQVKISYTLTDEDAFQITYTATTDARTTLNLTHHSFFNLKGAGNGTINDHILQLNAHRYTKIDDDMIPTGELAQVEGTPLDFRSPAVIGEKAKASAFEPLRLTKGYDHNFVINRPEKSADLAFAAKIHEQKSGRTLAVFTTEPGVQFYTGNFLDGTMVGKQNKVYKSQEAFCLEAQHFPDSPNHPHFPTTELAPGETYRQTTVYVFGVE